MLGLLNELQQGTCTQEIVKEDKELAIPAGSLEFTPNSVFTFTFPIRCIDSFAVILIAIYHTNQQVCIYILKYIARDKNIETDIRDCRFSKLPTSSG